MQLSFPVQPATSANALAEFPTFSDRRLTAKASSSSLVLHLQAKRLAKFQARSDAVTITPPRGSLVSSPVLRSNLSTNRQQYSESFSAEYYALLPRARHFSVASRCHSLRDAIDSDAYSVVHAGIRGAKIILPTPFRPARRTNNDIILGLSIPRSTNEPPARLPRALESPSSECDSTRSTPPDRVFVASIPLDAPPGPPQWVADVAGRIFPLLCSHWVVIVTRGDGEYFLFDFRPDDPQNLGVAVRVLALQPVPGFLLIRPLSRLPSRRCWSVGSSVHSDTLAAVQSFNATWRTDLTVFSHDCRDYSQALASHLTARGVNLSTLSDPSDARRHTPRPLWCNGQSDVCSA